MGFSHEKLLDGVPAHLRQYVVEQDYGNYTPRDQAVWRYIMNRNINFLSRHAHPAYLSGLEKTGINAEKIPDILVMNEKLQQIGWSAVVVNGFIPPAAFMEFQANGILVISAEIRSVEHIMYTPAPDIVHEAAGHAALIADRNYADYLRKFGEYGAKAISSKEDFAVYEAIRKLSIIKEYPAASANDIRQAEENLAQRLAENKIASEAALLSRLHWWTVEYGLSGTVNDFRLYGAGLLSSVGESKACLDPKIKKIPLSAGCVDYDYDITSMQPQLFVVEDWAHLHDVLEEFAGTMAFHQGGIRSLNQVIASGNIATVVYSSGLQVSGKITIAELTEAGGLCYLKTTGGTSLAFENRELAGHGASYHKDGFGSPVGNLTGTDKPLEEFTDGELADHGLVIANNSVLNFKSGITVTGRLKKIIRKKKKIILLGFGDCRVQKSDGTILFQPGWGDYDMAVGEKIISVFAGSADKEKFNVLPAKSETKAIDITYDAETQHLFSLYGAVARPENKNFSSIFTEIEQYPQEWLLRLELLKQIQHDTDYREQTQKLMAQLEQLKNYNDEYDQLISSGLDLIR